MFFLLCLMLCTPNVPGYHKSLDAPLTYRKIFIQIKTPPPLLKEFGRVMGACGRHSRFEIFLLFRHGLLYSQPDVQNFRKLHKSPAAFSIQDLLVLERRMFANLLHNSEKNFSLDFYPFEFSRVVKEFNMGSSGSCKKRIFIKEKAQILTKWKLSLLYRVSIIIMEFFFSSGGLNDNVYFI